MIKTASRVARIYFSPSTSAVRWVCSSDRCLLAYQRISLTPSWNSNGSHNLLQNDRATPLYSYFWCKNYATSSNSEQQHTSKDSTAEKMTAKQKKEAEKLERQAEREKRRLVKEAEQKAKASRKARHQYNKLAAANGMPKPPPSIFGRYLRDFAKESGKLSHADFMLQAQATWKQMDPAKKEALNKKYEDEYAAAKEIYDTELAQWHAKMIESGKQDIIDEMTELETVFRPPTEN